MIPYFWPVVYMYWAMYKNDCVGDLQANGSSPCPRPISVDIHEKQTPFSSL